MSYPGGGASCEMRQLKPGDMVIIVGGLCPCTACISLQGKYATVQRTDGINVTVRFLATQILVDDELDSTMPVADVCLVPAIQLAKLFHEERYSEKVNAENQES